ncbi:MAG: shikimate kinase [Bacteroidales bacterium]|nr:shikimate kinase [Bacteroidales bacterium]MDD3160298.1 shikimate kinase [Bacteroidales bacterium]
MQRIFLTGFMGSGKTTLGRFFAKENGYSFIDLDHYIEGRYFKTINQIFEESGEEGFRIMEQKALKEVAEIEDVIIATGGGTPCFFDNMDYMNSCGLTVFINVSISELTIRLEKAKSKRPLLKDKSKEEIGEYIKEKLQARLPYYQKSHLTIDGKEMYKKEDLAKMCESLQSQICSWKAKKE